MINQFVEQPDANEYIIPNIGTSGYYTLSAPFDALIIDKEKYTCMSLRKISDYLANNEDPKENIYDLYNINESVYNEHLKKNIVICSLQSNTGHWLHVPVNYITKFPIPNGIPYQSYMIGVALPPIPVEKDLSNTLTSITNIITDTLGINCQIKITELSKVNLIPEDTHITKQAQRDLVINGNLTDRSRYTKLMQDHNTALAKILELETYIKNNI